MSQPSPPKPWERPGAPVEPAPPVPTTVPTATTTSDSPLVPSRPSTIGSSTILPTTSPYSTMNPLNSSYSSPYSSFGSYSSPYSSYNRFGSYGSPYSSYGGYGSTYGGYGMGGYGYGMGMNSMNPMMDPNNPSLIQQVESSTQQTFQLLQSIVQTFGSFAQMLDSTFMATHSSFFAMLGVAEQFGHMRQALGQVAGVFGLVGWLRGWWRGDKANMASDFKRFLADGGASVPGSQPGQPGRPRPSKKPLVIFLIAVFGLPYLMHKLVKRIMARLPPPGTTGPQGLPLNIDPSKLTFARAVFPFPSKDPVELSLAKGDIVAVLSTADPATGAESEWWRGRTRDGREGWFPRAFVETIKPKEVSDAAQAPPLAPPKVVD